LAGDIIPDSRATSPGISTASLPGACKMARGQAFAPLAGRCVPDRHTNAQALFRHEGERGVASRLRQLEKMHTE